ncbi:MAG: hypothetical protein JSU86_16745 [Phycisphaerales bacterium]|nr:MAG: hypothetical protein JSU86_16745 [Phycisphaerales bacterium]
MYQEDAHFEDMLKNAEMKIDPNPEHVRAVRERMNAVSRNGAHVGGRHRSAWVVCLVLCGICGVGLAGTETGRDLVRWILTPVHPRHEITVTTPDGTTWSRSGAVDPHDPQDREKVAREFAEMAELAEAGLGELTGMIETPDHTVYMVEYTLKDGTTSSAGGELTDRQAVNMRIDEIQQLRDAGAGEVIMRIKAPIGLGLYTIRFALSDRTVDLQMWYPPGTRQEREAIFSETRRLKSELRFSVEDARVSNENPEQGVWGTLRYTLADGRTVGIVEQVPAEAITADGAFVAVPDTGETPDTEADVTWTSPDGSQYTLSGGPGPDSPEEREAVVDTFREIHSIKQAGGGRLVGLREGPGWSGELSRTSYDVEYTLASGETMNMGEGALSSAQKATVRVDEIQRLRDNGAGEIISQSESDVGLGRFTIRFTLPDGQTVDLQTSYPPGTRQERTAIFAETRELRAQRRFTVSNARGDPESGVWGVFLYTLSDGRAVGHRERVPSDMISSDGAHIVIPGTGETIELQAPPGR